MNDNPSPETTEATIASAGAPTAVLTDGQVAGQLARQLEELSNPDWYINREISWLEFNDRVLQLAEDESLPLIERCKFLAIFTTNLDEFFMVRVAGVHDQVDARIDARGPDGLSPTEMLEQISETVREQDRRQAREFSERVRPALAEQGIRIVGVRRVPRTPDGADRAAVPRGDLPGADAARDRPGPAVPVHLEPVAQPDRASARPRDRRTRCSPA